MLPKGPQVGEKHVLTIFNFSDYYCFTKRVILIVFCKICRRIAPFCIPPKCLTPQMPIFERRSCDKTSERNKNKSKWSKAPAATFQDQKHIFH